MELSIKYEKDDWEAFQSYLEKDLCESTKSWHESMWANFVIWLLIAFVFFSYLQSDLGFSWPTAGIVSFFFISGATFLDMGFTEWFRTAEGSFGDDHQPDGGPPLALAAFVTLWVYLAFFLPYTSVFDNAAVNA